MKERKEGKKYKRDELPHGEDDEKNQRKHHYVTKNYNFCISLREIYKNIHSSDLTEKSLFCSNCLFIPLITNLLWPISS